MIWPVPVWAAIVIAVLSGLGGGLIGTLVKAAEDRTAEVRRATIEATRDFAALATDWFALVDEAIREHERRLGPDDETRAKADDALRQGRKRLDRLAVLLGPDTDVVQRGAETLEFLASALDELPDALSDIELELTDDEEAEFAALSDDEHGDRFGELQGESFDEGIGEARILQRMGLATWRGFTESASRELRRGFFPRVRLPTRGARRGARGRRRRRL